MREKGRRNGNITAMLISQGMSVIKEKTGCIWFQVCHSCSKFILDEQATEIASLTQCDIVIRHYDAKQCLIHVIF